MINNFDGEYKENLLHAEELEYSGDYKSAAELYSHLATVARLQKEPQWDLIIALLTHSGYCFQKSNQQERLNKCLDRIQKLQSQHNVETDFHIGQTLHNTDHYELIRGFDKDFIDKSDMQLISFLNTLHIKAREAESEKNFRAAAARYARIAELHKRIQPIDYNSLRESLEKTGHYLNIIKSYRQSLFFYEEAMKINVRLDENEQHIAVNYNNISFIYTQLNDHEQALHYCQKALVMNERLQNREQIAVNVSNLGQIYLKSQNYDKALKNFAHAIELKTRLGKRKDIAQEMYNLGMVYAATEKYKAAIARIENAVNMMSQLNNKEEVARYSASLGDLYKKFGQQDMAIQYFEKSFSTYYLVSKKARASEILQTLTSLYQEQDNHEQAVKCIRQNIAIQEAIGNTKMVESHLKKVAHIYYQLEDFKEAIGYYLKAIEIKKDSYTPELRYRDLFTVGLWYNKSQQYNKSVEYLQKAASVLDENTQIPQDEVYFFLGENFTQLKKWPEALDCLYHACNTTDHWYRKNIHLLKIAYIYIATDKYPDAKKCYNSITQFCQTSRQTKNVLLIPITKWQNSAREHEEVHSYYLEIFTLCSMSKFYWQLEKYTIALEYLLFATNLLKDIIAIDAKGIYQEKYNENLYEFSAEPYFNRHERFTEHISKIEELFVTILQQSKKDIPALRSTVFQLFNANDSLYGIEFCEQLLLTSEPYISKKNMAYFLSQMALRFKQLESHGKSLFYYSWSCSVYIAAHAGESFLSTLEKLNTVWKLLLENPNNFEFESCDYIEEIMKVAYSLASKNLYLQLAENLWGAYSSLELEDMAELHLKKSSEMCAKMDDFEKHIAFLEMLSECYRAQGKDEHVISTQVSICDLRDQHEREEQLADQQTVNNDSQYQPLQIDEQDKKEDQSKTEQKISKQPEKDAFSDTYLPLDIPEKDSTPVRENPNTLQKMGETYMSLKRYEDALLNLNALLVLYEEAEDVSKIANTLIRISGIHFAQNEFSEALKSLEKTMSIARSIPDFDLLRKSLIKFHEAYSNPELFSKGIDFFQKMLEIDKDRDEFFALETYFLANLLEKNNQTVKAITFYERALELYETAQEKNENIDHIFCLQQLINLYKKQNSFSKIISTYQKLFDACEQLNLNDTLTICEKELYNTCWDHYQNFLSAKDKTSFSENIFDVLHFLAQNKWQEGKIEDISYEDSIASLRQACYLYDKIKEFCADQLENIEEENNKCILSLSESLQALGDYHMNFDNYERAITYYEEDIELRETITASRETIEIFRKLSTAYQKSEDCENAISVMEKTIVCANKICSPEEKVSLLFDTAKLHFELENFNEVRNYCEKAIDTIEKNEVIDDNLKNEIQKLIMSSDV
ncbi:tetratricopeptide repeat protein [Candidatus Uabimicrobium sp. HlEnr_7]|uniref:tetratricopeptide repeat protein n=1 Tax=Candidatus Uabimicrobium helgolandensis TaxID=3095367 RepID=UPI00355701F0